MPSHRCSVGQWVSPCGSDSCSSLANALASWAEDAWDNLRRGYPRLESGLLSHVNGIQKFSKEALPPGAHELPVAYLMSGVDLLTAHALFPRSPHYLMFADLPLGSPDCFFDDGCREVAIYGLAHYFSQWSYQHFAWTQTNQMHRRFDSRTDNMTVGVLPALVLSLYLTGQTVTSVYVDTEWSPGISTSSAAGAQFTKLTLHTNASRRVTFVSGRLSSNASLAPKQLQRYVLHPLQGHSRHAILLKAAEGAYRILGNAQVASTLLRRCEVAVHDETGLLPHAYQSPDWVVRTYGNASMLAKTYTCLGIPPEPALMTAFEQDRKATLREAFSGQRLLPFVFGYGKHSCGSNGLMLTAWRQHARLSSATE